MHWVENTQYCTVHGGKTQRREQVLMGQHHWLTHLRQETKRFCSPVSRKEGVGDCKHLLQGRGMETSASIGYF